MKLMYKTCKGNSEEEEAMITLVAMLPALIYNIVNVDAYIQAAVCIRVAGRSKVSRKSA